MNVKRAHLSRAVTLVLLLSQVALFFNAMNGVAAVRMPHESEEPLVGPFFVAVAGQLLTSPLVLYFIYAAWRDRFSLMPRGKAWLIVVYVMLVVALETVAAATAGIGGSTSSMHAADRLSYVMFVSQLILAVVLCGLCAYVLILPLLERVRKPFQKRVS